MQFLTYESPAPTPEDTVVQAALFPLVSAKLDELSDALAKSHAPIHATEEGIKSYDMEAGRKTARRALIESLLMWLETDDALDGNEIAVIEHK